MRKIAVAAVFGLAAGLFAAGAAIGAAAVAAAAPQAPAAKGEAEATGAAAAAPADRPWLPCPYPPSDTVRGIEFDISTHRREAIGSDIWPITWADDGHQYSPWGDGAGFGADGNAKAQKAGRVSLGVARIEGPVGAYRGVNVWGGWKAENPAQFAGKGTGILSVGGVLYMLMAGPGSNTVPETRLAVSRDHSRTWQLADWNWTAVRDRVFAGAFLNFGKDYEGARDEYVYAYFTHLDDPPPADKPRNWRYEVPGRVALARVPKDRLLDRAAWQWFAGFDDRGGPRWTADPAARAHAFEDPNGLKVVSVSHHAHLKKYLLTYSPKDNRGNFALFEASEPWGPWRAAAYLKGHALFMPPEPNQRVAIFHFPAKWWSGDGRQGTLLFNTGDDAWNTVCVRLR